MYTAEYDVVCSASGVANFIAALDYTQGTGWMWKAGKVWWPQPDRPTSQSRQPPFTSHLQPWQPQEQGIWWSWAPQLTLTHAMIRFAGHLVEQTHLYQAGQIIERVQSWPVLPKPMEVVLGRAAVRVRQRSRAAAVQVCRLCLARRQG